jgi:hypothetical protein
MQNVQQQIKDFHAAREDAAAAAELDQEMADNRHLIATTGEALRSRQAEDREAGQ